MNCVLTQEEIDYLVKEFVDWFNPIKILVLKESLEKDQINGYEYEICLIVDDTYDIETVREQAYMIVFQAILSKCIGPHLISTFPISEKAFLKKVANGVAVYSRFQMSGETIFERK